MEGEKKKEQWQQHGSLFGQAKLKEKSVSK